VGGLRHHDLRDGFADPAGREQRADPGQVAVQRAGDPEPVRSVQRRHPAGERDLLGDPAAERDRVEPAVLDERDLLLDLVASERDHLGVLGCGERGADLLHRGDAVDPYGTGRRSR